jgi:F0F1-type ATP synthase membrane subunit b/b'
MDIFDWVKDIEETYKYLIEKAKDESLKVTQDYKVQQEKELENTIKTKQRLIDSTLATLSEEVHDEVKQFDEQIIGALKNIEKTFKRKRKTFVKEILKKIELEF